MHYLVQKNPDQVIIYHYCMHKEEKNKLYGGFTIHTNRSCIVIEYGKG